MRSSRLFAIGLWCGWLGGPAVFAQSADELPALRQQVREQASQIRSLLERVQALEHQMGKVSTPAAPPAQAETALRPDPPKEAAASPRYHFGGFADATGVYRSTFTGGGIVTPFGSIPLQGTPEAGLGELRGAANHSRLNFRFDGRLAGRDLTAYVESDFLGNTVANVFAGSNSHPLRLRLYWVQLRGGGYELLGGQSWSLLAPNRRGISPLPADVMSTQVIDPNYSVGLVWTRQATVRLTRHWDRWTLAVAAENPEQRVLGSEQAPQDTRGLATGATPGANIAPDVIVKAAYDASWAHLEAAAIGRRFQVYSGGRQARDSANGAGLSLAAVVHAGSRTDFVTQNFLSAGGGRYAQGLIPDVAVRPDGHVARIATFSFLQGVETKPVAAVSAYGYWGLVYGRRVSYLAADGSLVGFGVGATLDNRTVQQTTVGFRHTVWSEAGHGSLSYAINYSYLNRNLWQAVSGGTSGHSHMLYTSFRYQLP